MKANVCILKILFIVTLLLAISPTHTNVSHVVAQSVASTDLPTISDITWTPDSLAFVTSVGNLILPLDIPLFGCISKAEFLDVSIIGINGSPQLSVLRPDSNCSIIQADIDSTGQRILLLDGANIEIWSLLNSSKISALGGFTAYLSVQWSLNNLNILKTGLTGITITDISLQNTLSSMLIRSLSSTARFSESIWSPDNTLVASSTNEGPIYVWNTQTRRGVVQTTFTQHTTRVRHLVWNATNNLIASGDDAGNIWIWDPVSGSPIMQLIGHTGAVVSLDWLPNGDQLASVDIDGTLHFWDYPSGRHVSMSSPGTTALAYSPDGTKLAYNVGTAFTVLDQPQLLTSVPTITPTPPPPPTATVTPAPLMRLRLTSMCSADPATSRVWRVRNTNAAETLVTWDVVGTAQTGSLIVPAAVNGVAGEALFQTGAVAGSNTTRLFLNSVQQDVKASGGAVCP